MSLVDPLSRWWNRRSVRRVGAWVSWCVALVAAALASAALAASIDPAGGEPAAWIVPICSVVALLALIAGSFLYLIGTDSEDFSVRAVVHPLGGLFTVMGAVAIAYDLANGIGVDGTMIGFFIAGILVIIVGEIIIRRVESNARLRDDVLGSGVVTAGVVTRATGYDENYRRVTRVTVRFTDREGRDRYAAAVLGGRFVMGASVMVRYLPSALNKRAGVVVSVR